MSQRLPELELQVGPDLLEGVDAVEIEVGRD
jgi:hypothetical protein